MLLSLVEDWDVRLEGEDDGGRWTLTIRVKHAPFEPAIVYTGFSLTRIVAAAWAGEAGGHKYA